MIPKYSDIHIPLISELYKRGGKAKPSDIDQFGKTIYDSLADYFDLSIEERNILTKNKTSENKWNNMVRWARNDLRKKGLVDASERGVWKLTSEAEKLLETVLSEEVGRGNFTKTTKAIDLETFRKLQEKAIEIGEMGEKYVLEKEREKLEKNGRFDLMKKVRQISLENVAEGYDILSFDENGEEMFIEVKSTSSNNFQFEFTDNEYVKSKKYGDSYWIYRVINIGSKNPQVYKYNNPAKLIEKGLLGIKPISWRITVSEDV